MGFYTIWNTQRLVDMKNLTKKKKNISKPPVPQWCRKERERIEKSPIELFVRMLIVISFPILQALTLTLTLKADLHLLKNVLRQENFHACAVHFSQISFATFLD